MSSVLKTKKYSIFCLAVLLFAGAALADRSRGGVPFLLIGPGARATGMGEAFVSIADDATATYWNPAGLGRYPLSSQWLDFSKPPGDKIVGIATEKTGIFSMDYRAYDIWAATDSGLFVLDDKKWRKGEVYTTAEEETMLGVINHFIDEASYDSAAVYDRIIPAVLKANDLTELPEGYLPPETKIKIPFSALLEGNVTALLGVKKELWVGTDKGLYVRRRGRWEVESDENGPVGKKVTVIAVDNREYLYVGTDSGLYMLKGARWIRYTTNNGLPSNKITSIYARGSHKDIWVGTELGPAHSAGDEWENTYETEPIPDANWQDFVRQHFSVDAATQVDYIASELKRVNGAGENDRPKTGERVEVPYSAVFESPVTAIFVDNMGTVWFGTELGLKSYDGKKWKSFGWATTTIEEDIKIIDWIKERWPNASDELVRELEKDLRYCNRMNEHNFKAGAVIAYPKSPVSGRITSLERAPDNNLLVGTEFGTLSYDRERGRFRYYVYGNLKDEQLDNIIREGEEYWFNTGDDVVVYSKGKNGISFMHVKWLPTLADDLYYEYLTGTTYLEGWGTIGGAITYISLGRNMQTDEAGVEIGEFYSYELAALASYGTRLSDNLTAGLTFKFIYSGLAPGVRVALEQEEGVAKTFAIDGGFQYDTPIKGLTVAASVQNLGPDIHYIDAAQADPLPRNLKLGVGWKIIETEYNRFIFAADINKSLIDWGNDPILKEYHEAVKNLGVEYTYANFISLRGGYMVDYDYYATEDASVIRSEEFNPDHWDATHYFTVGAGLRFRNFAFDFGYIPNHSDDEGQDLPLSNILRYSVSFTF